jgi:hypothetical protein
MLYSACMYPHLVYIYRFSLLYENLAEKFCRVVSRRIVLRLDTFSHSSIFYTFGYIVILVIS